MNRNKATISTQEGEAPAIKGMTVLSVMTAQVEDLEQRIRTVVDSIDNLTNDSRSISAVLITIKNIADETNFLALNAAIEAARACDNGRGFTVVSDIVLALARQTTDSAEQINHLLAKLASSTVKAKNDMQDSLEQSNAAVAHSLRVEGALAGVLDAVTIIKDISIQAPAITDEQHQAADTLNRHIDGINRDATLLARVSGTTKSVTSSLVQATEKLNTLIGRFKIS